MKNNQQLFAGLLLIAAPVLFNGAFVALSSRFDYPAILRQPAGDVLTRFAAGGVPLLATWYVMFAAALLLIPLTLATAKSLGGRHEQAATTFGVLAGLVQALGLARWVFVTPYLAEAYTGGNATIATQEAVTVVFEAFNRYLGVGIGEHLGYLFTGFWTLTVARGLWESNRRGAAVVGAASGALILAGLGEATSAVWAQIATVVGYLVWALWLITLGVQTMWQTVRPPRVTGGQIVAVVLLLAGFLVAVPNVRAQTVETPRPTDTLYIHAFRSPAIGLEYRRGDLGLYAGGYTTILSRDGGGNETAWFSKVGVTYYYKTPFVKQNRSRLESFISVAYLRGTASSWRDKNAVFLDSGIRYRLGGGFEARLGTGVLIGEGHTPRINPTPGISYSVPLR